jgi:peptidylprolyl isomerase
MRHTLIAALALPLLLAAAPAKQPTTAEVLAAAPAAAWKTIPADELLVMETPRGPVIVQLVPIFAPAHVAAIKALVAAGRFDGGSVVRVQDNYVVQWAAKEGRATPPETPPAGIKPLPAEYERPVTGLRFVPLPYRDAYGEAGYVDGWPAARDPKTGTAWLAHCYAMVGVGRNLPPDTGDGTELYAVIGHAPRHLDRNMATVGRVIDGLPSLTSLPRGTEALGFYKTEAERTPVTRIRLATALPEAERPHFRVMDTNSASFAAFVKARANRSDPFFARPAGAVDLCNAPVPIRKAP